MGSGRRDWRPSPPLVVSFVALFVALSGVAVALERGAVGPKHIAENAVRSKHVKAGQLKSSDLKNGKAVKGVDVVDGTLTGTDLDEATRDGLVGPAGERGLPGPAGPAGPVGPEGPATGPAGGDLVGDFPDPRIAPGAITPAKVAAVPAARARVAGSVVVPSNTGTPLSYTAEVFDTADIFNPAQNTRLTAPIDGVFTITGTVVWGPAAPDDEAEVSARRIFISQNDDNHLLAAEEDLNVPGGVLLQQSVSTIAGLGAGDYVDLAAHQTSTVPVNVINNGGVPAFSIAWVGPLP